MKATSPVDITPPPGVIGGAYAARLIRFKAWQASRWPCFARDERADLEQELWTDLLARLRRYDARRSSVKTFIARVVSRRIASLVRHRLAAKRSPRRDPAWFDAPASRDGWDEVGEGGGWRAEAGHGPARIDRACDIAKLCAQLSGDPTVSALIVRLSRGDAITAIAKDLGVSRRVIDRAVAEIRRTLVQAGLHPRDAAEKDVANEPGADAEMRPPARCDATQAHE